MMVSARCCLAGMLLLVATANVAAQSWESFTQTERHMGTDFTIRVWAACKVDADRGFQVAFERIRLLESVMSDYDANSEISKLAMQAPMQQPVRISRDLWEVLKISQGISRASNGAFDVSIGPLSRLWRRARRQKQMPSRERLAQAMDAVGYEALRLGSDRPTLQLQRAGMRMDLGGIGKGFAADAALAALRKLGLPMALVDAGGDLALGASPPGQQGWRIGVAPLQPDGPPSRYLQLQDCGIATSGDAWQFVELDGKRYSHIVDPRTGVGLTTRSSVTVIAPNATTADGMASAISVLGPRGGLVLVNSQPGVSALVVQETGRGVQSWKSCDFPKR